MLESDEYATIREIASAEKINETYVGRVLRLTLPAPDIVEAIIVGRPLPDLQLEDLLWRFPVGWRDQRAEFLRPAYPKQPNVVRHRASVALLNPATP